MAVIECFYHKWHELVISILRMFLLFSFIVRLFEAHPTLLIRKQFIDILCRASIE